jgi:hypothetical protein
LHGTVTVAEAVCDWGHAGFGFGGGKLKELVEPREQEGKDVYILFNNLSMFEDGTRFMQYLLIGTFPKITSSIGLASVREVVERTQYPVSIRAYPGIRRVLPCRIL